MLLLVIFAILLRLIDEGSGTSDEEYESAVTASTIRFQSSQELAPSESALCHICGLCFRHLAVHISVHNHQKPFKCSQCDKQFTRTSNLRRHQAIHSGEKLHGCPSCGRQFVHPESLQKHQELHIYVKSLRCEECGKQFAYAQHLRTHQRTHNGERPFTCPECGKQFKRADSLRDHQRIHSGEKPFRCTECEKCLACPSNLLRHQRLHRGMKFFNCSHCSKQFTCPGNVRRHLRKHNGEKPFECLRCGTCFERVDDLTDHQQKKHAVLENSTSSSSLGYEDASSIVENPTLFQSIFQHSSDSSPAVRSENLTACNCSSLTQTDQENLDDSPSFAPIKGLTFMKNPSLEIRSKDTFIVEMRVSAAMEDPLLLHPVLENPIESLSLTQMNNPTELESPTLLHLKDPINYPPLSENPIESLFFAGLQNRVIFKDPYLFPVDNSSLIQKEEYTAQQELMAGPSLVQADTRSVPKTSLDRALFIQMQEHFLTDPEGSASDIQLRPGDLDAVSGNAYWECPVCFGRFGERETLEDHMLNSSCSLFPMHWQPYLDSGDNSDFAK